MGFNFRLDYVMQFFTLLGPIILPSVIVLLSFFNADLKGLVYLAGLVIIVGLSTLMKGMTAPRNNDLTYSPSCYVLDIGSISIDGLRTLPDLHSSIMSFTVAYLLFPVAVGGLKEHLPASIGLLAYLVLNVFSRKWNKCVQWVDIAAGVILGTLFGIAYYFIITALGGNKLAYFTEGEKDPNNPQCNRVTEAKWKCKVYKDGSPITGPGANDEAVINATKAALSQVFGVDAIAGVQDDDDEEDPQ